jgi:hypothetical protein
MLLAALVCGLVTAYYFGLRPGVTAALVALVLFLAAAIIPGAALVAYLAVGGGLAGVFALGSRRPRDPVVGRAIDASKQLVTRVWRQRRK